MNYILNRFIIYSVMLLILAMIVILFGCEAQNPICSDNFCVVGEIFPRSELEENQEFSEVDVDDRQILAVLIATSPPTTQPDTEITLTDIVADVATGGIRYVGRIVTITATVDATATTDTVRYIVLVTNNVDVTFFVNVYGDLDTPLSYIDGNSYTFTVYINDVKEAQIAPGLKNIWTYEIGPKTEATLSDILSDVEAGKTTYLHHIATVTGIVIWKSSSGNSIVISDDGNLEDVAFFVSSVGDPDKLLVYEIGSTYTFTVFIEIIAEHETDPTKTNIWASLVVND